MSNYFAVIEAGGTKFNCAIVNQHREILVTERIATTTPNQTLAQTIAFFQSQRRHGFEFDKLGLACFGPLDLNSDSDKYGSITTTPKLGWRNTPILNHLSNELLCDVFIDTDVNAAALAEQSWGAGRKCSNLVYVTIGTGVGAGVAINGEAVHGLIHPEIGHMLVGAQSDIKGVCPFHQNCVEGLVSGTAIKKIWGKSAEELEDNHPAWQFTAEIIGRFCHNLLMTFSPQVVVLGGGVMQKPGLLSKVIDYTQHSLGNYLTFPNNIQIEDIIQAPGLGEQSGLLGALALIKQD